MKACDVMLRVTGPDFCAAAVFADHEPTFVCIEAAPKLEALVGMDLDKATRRCEALGWTVEQLRVTPELIIDPDPSQPDPQRAPRLRASGRFDLL